MKSNYYLAFALISTIAFNILSAQQIRFTNNSNTNIMNKKENNNEIEILVEFTLKPGVLNEFEAILLPHLEKVTSEETCLMMAASRDEKDETKYILYERWKDEKEFWEVQMKRPYRIPYNKNIAPFEAAERKVTMYKSRFFRMK